MEQVQSGTYDEFLALGHLGAFVVTEPATRRGLYVAEKNEPWLPDAARALGVPLPSAHGMVAWTIDPILATLAGTQANVHLAGVYLKKGQTIANLAVPVTAAAVAPTHAQLGIYDAALNLLASSADTPNAFLATGWVPLALSAPWTCPEDGLYYLASGFAAATTLPTVLNFAQNAAVSVGFPGATKPRGVHAQAQGTLPAVAVSQGTFTNFPCIVAY